MGKINSYKHIFFDLDHTLWDYEKIPMKPWANYF